MKKMISFLLLALPFIVNAQNAKIKIDIERTIGEIDQKKQNEYLPVKTDVATKNNKLSCTFPPHSFTQIKIMVREK